jgi:DNA-binding winged helix-turn-helix (wHTH) protein
MSDQRLHHIGSLTLDLGTGRLIGPGGDIDIRPKTYAMLALPAREAGRVVAKDDLMLAIWPDVIVTEDSLSQCAHDLRKALGPERNALRTFPKRGYMLETARRPALAATAPAMASVPPGSIAVLPFDASPDADEREGILLDGLAHDVISGLASLRSFDVTGRGSAFALRGMGQDPQAIRQLLRVDHAVTGRILPDAGGHRRLLLDLIRTDKGTLVWTGEIALGTATTATVARDAVEACVAALSAALMRSGISRSVRSPGESPPAWESFHLGLDQVFRFEPHAMSSALGHFEAAARSDPKSARAFAFQSFCHYFFAFADASSNRADSMRAAISAAGTALDIDDESPSAHWAYGRALCLNGDPGGARDHCARAVAIAPSFPHAHYMLGFIEANHGDARRALIHLDRSEAVSPIDPFNASILLTRAIAQLRLGDHDTAADCAARAARQRNAYPQILYPCALVLAATGRGEDASAILQRVRRLHPSYAPDSLFQSLYGMDDALRDTFARARSHLGG